MSDSNWFYTLGGEQKGPVSTDQIQALEQAGVIKSDTLVWQEGMAEWKPALQTGLSDLFPDWKRRPPPIPNNDRPQASQNSPDAHQDDQRAYYESRGEGEGGKGLTEGLKSWTIGILNFNAGYALIMAFLYFKVASDGSAQAINSKLAMLENPLLLLGELALFVMGVAFYLVWLVRALKFYNQDLPVERRKSPTFAAWSHFIPIVWFWGPFEAVRAIKHGAQRRYPECGGNFGSPALWWAVTWLGFVVMLFTIGASESAAQSGTLSDLKLSLAFQVAEYALSGVATFVLIRIVKDSFEALEPAAEGAPA